MFAIIKKEIEQRYWLILVGCFFFAFLHYWTYFDAEQWTQIQSVYLETPRDHYNLVEVIYPDLETHLLFLLLYGAITGFSMFFSEMSPKNWFFLKHRSLPGSRVLFGKMVAGTIIYAVPTLLFSLGQVYWIATPEKMATPWAWEFLLIIYYPIIWGWAAMFCFLSIAQPGLKIWRRIMLPFSFLVPLVYVISVFNDIVSWPSLWIPLIVGLFLVFLFGVHLQTQLSLIGGSD